jgi:putative FmdB family regulatory protein
MPTYEYECKSCGHTFEIFQAMSDAPLNICPECGREVRRLIHGGTGVIFKGSGFYVTDKGKVSAGAVVKNTKPEEAASAVSKGDAGSEQSPAASSAKNAGSGGETGGGESVPNKTGSAEKAKPAAKTA